MTNSEVRDFKTGVGRIRSKLSSIINQKLALSNCCSSGSLSCRDRMGCILPCAGGVQLPMGCCHMEVRCLPKYQSLCNGHGDRSQHTYLTESEGWFRE